jgi:dihydrofolate synthase/folylpolyglutamate synthase
MSLKPINFSPDAYLASFDKFGIHLGLERITDLLTRLGNPHTQVPIIHVAGTNGKGSVCAFLLSILQNAGYRVGRYTSPHLLDWRERISINGDWISEQDLGAALQAVDRAIAPDLPPTQFEVFTAAMWWYFADQKRHHNLDLAILETGLGGRLDATNVCDRPLVSVITAIGLDHCQQLGNTLGAIASEKAGIIKPQCPIVVAANAPEAIAAIQTKAKNCDAPITLVEPAQVTPEGAMYQGLNYPLPLLGKHQLLNSALAIATIKILRNQGWQVSDRAIAEGMAQTEWAGRLQWIDFNLHGETHKILIDGAHNVAAAEYLRQFMDETYPHQRRIWLIGILNTKDQTGILKALLHPDDLCITVPVPSAATTAPADLGKFADQFLNSPAIACPDLSSGLAAAFANRRSPDIDRLDMSSIVVLCGSLYLAGEFLRVYAD